MVEKLSIYTDQIRSSHVSKLNAGRRTFLRCGVMVVALLVVCYSG